MPRGNLSYLQALAWSSSDIAATGRTTRMPTASAGSSVYHQGLCGKLGSINFHSSSSDASRAPLRSAGATSWEADRTTWVDLELVDSYRLHPGLREVWPRLREELLGG